MNPRKNSSTLPFLDVIFNTLLIVSAVTIAAAIVQNTASVETKARYIIEMKWDKGSKNDVDLYVMDPQEKIVFFNQPGIGLMHLERDDRGSASDTKKLPDGSIMEFLWNDEHVYLRGVMPGEYVVNVHLYEKEDDGDAPVHVVLRENVEGTIVTRIEKDLLLRDKGDEKTAFRFTLDIEGSIINTNDLFKRIAIKARGY
ncbi:hypothetical protein L0Y49_04310 [bacterium]|nr:hypothetical protein [bacterium]MCI0566208.1 hypothetical protein [bacterium]MCI0679765.1 hypothetical protein [bacterium]